MQRPGLPAITEQDRVYRVQVARRGRLCGRPPQVVTGIWREEGGNCGVLVIDALLNRTSVVLSGVASVALGICVRA
jgi:hypothetical protein